MPLDNTDVTYILNLPTLTPSAAQSGDVVPVYRSGQSTPLQQATLSIQPIRAITYVMDGGGSVLATGVRGSLYVPFACTITAATLLAPHQIGSIVVDVWKTPLGSYPASAGNSICASDLPTLSAAREMTDTTLTGWTTAISAGDTLTFNINSVTSLDEATLILTVQTN
jgi:hypothetical protein